MATTTNSPAGTSDDSPGTTRRGFLRLLGSVAVAGALAAAGATGGREAAHARRHGKKRRQRQKDRPNQATARAIADADLAFDPAGDSQALYGIRCHWQIVCYPNGACRRRKVCW